MTHYDRTDAIADTNGMPTDVRGAANKAAVSRAIQKQNRDDEGNRWHRRMWNSVLAAFGSSPLPGVDPEPS